MTETTRRYTSEEQEQKRKYYIQNKKQIQERKAEKITCECGSVYARGTQARHFKTQVHITATK